MSAAIKATETFKPNEFQEIRQRHSYYDYISYAIEFDPKTPAPSREIRFFHAATSVTVMAEIGMVEGFVASHLESWFPEVAKRWGVTQQTLEFLRDVNAVLLKQNMGVIRNILFSWKFPKDPRAAAPTEKMEALDFDVAMVDFEQTAVQNFINNSAVPQSILSNVDRIVARGPVFSWLSTFAQVKPWLSAAGFSKIEFSKYERRVAVGRALVFLFHSKTKNDYVEYMRQHPPTTKPRPKLYSGILSPKEISHSVAGNFTIVGSWKTLNGAQRHLAELRREHLGIDAVIFPPYGRDKYWTVAISSFASTEVASELSKEARRQHVAKDAYTLRRRAVDAIGRPFLVAPQSINASNFPNLILAASEGASRVRDSNVIALFHDADKQKAELRLHELQRLYPDVKLAMFQDKESSDYVITLASFVSQTVADQAIAIARHMNVPESEIRIMSIVDPSVLERVGAVSESPVVSTIVRKCYSAGKVSVQALHDCSGFWLTESTLVRCLLESDCRALDDTVLSTRQQVDTFLTTHELHLETELKLDPSKLPFPADANALVSNIQQCRNKAQNDSSVFLACMAVDSGPASGKEAVSCAASNTKAQDIVTCLANATQSPQLSRITGCIKGDNQDPKQTVTCLLNDEDKANVEKMEKCLRDASSAQTALETCPEKFLPDDQKKKIRCITAAGTNASAVASCALPSSSDAQTAIRALNCAHDAASTAAAAQCLAAITGGEAGRLAECVTPDGDRASTIACMLRDRPELSRAQTLYKCASGGTDTASLIANCSDGILDERSQQIAKCIAQQGSDRNALAGCAASTILPKEFGPAIRCASESTGGADFAVCMAGPVMNEEWRIAAECAVETGGAPPAFAVCAAGRLTVKELTKCLSGQIGTEGGCFGPHNTIVEAFATVGHDLGNCLSGGACLGPNNEIVKAAKAIEEGVSHLGHEGERIWHGLFGRGSHWCRGDLTRWTC